MLSRLPWRLILATTLAIVPLTGRGQLDHEFPGQAYPPLEHFREIIQRPLFEENRRPRQQDIPSPTSATGQALQKKWRLTGVVWEGEQKLALFSERQGAARHRLKTGMYLDNGWLLEEIQVDTVTLTDGTQQLVLQLGEPGEFTAEQDTSRPNPLPVPPKPTR